MNPRLLQRHQVALAGVAGLVDAVGARVFGDFNIAFMSGNTVTLGSGAAAGHWPAALFAVVLVGSFTAGVAGGTALGAQLGRARPPLLLLGVAASLAAAPFAQEAGLPMLAGGLAAAGMGTVNTVFNEPGKASTGLTYMTGTLVRIGQNLVRPRDGWARLGPDLALWAGLGLGAAAGALLYGTAGFTTLWAGAALAGLLAGTAALAVVRNGRR